MNEAGLTGYAVEQGDEADEAGASDGASQLIPGVRQTNGIEVVASAEALGGRCLALGCGTEV